MIVVVVVLVINTIIQYFLLFQYFSYNYNNNCFYSYKELIYSISNI